VIGNDIVDLSLSYKSRRTLSDRFLNKLFTKAEQELIRNSSIPEDTLWLLWSMKESAYKVYVQQGNQPSFAPTKFRGTISGNDQSYVTADQSVYYTSTTITGNYVHSIAGLEPKTSYSVEFLKLTKSNYQEQHQACLNKLKAIYAGYTEIPTEQMVVRKNTFGVPQLYINNLKADFSFSISHHGRYAAVVIRN